MRLRKRAPFLALAAAFLAGVAVFVAAPHAAAQAAGALLEGESFLAPFAAPDATRSPAEARAVTYRMAATWFVPGGRDARACGPKRRVY